MSDPVGTPSSSWTLLYGLIQRDRQTRFSGGAFGYLWAYATPVAWIVLVVVFFQLLGRVPPLAVSAEIFVATGILPYVMFRQTITSMMRTLIANRYMLYIRPITSRDILLSTALLEFANMVTTSLVIFGGLIIFFDVPPPAHLLTVYGAMGSAWVLGMGFGSLMAAFGQWSDGFARAVPLALRPMFWISGIFYTAIELPTPAQNLLWWNPLFHSIETLREGFFLGYHSPVGELWMPYMVGLLFYLMSLAVTRFVEQTRRARHRL